MKHIVLLKAGSSKKGGLERYVDRLIAGFLKRNTKVTLLTSGCVQQEDGYEKISLCPQYSLSYLHLLRFDKACNEWIKKNGASTVFGLDRNSFQTHYRAGNGVHAAYLQQRSSDEGFFKSLTFKLNPLHKAILSLERKTYENPSIKKIYTNSQMVKDEILSNYRADPQKIHVVHNGVEFDECENAFNASPKDRCTTHQFLFIGYGWHRKGLAHLLQALSLLKQESFHLTIIGSDHNSTYFESLTDTLGLRKKVSFLGAKPSVLPFLQQADTLVVPSTYDPFANVTLEALAMGVFVVSSKFNGAHELLNKENGTIIQDLYDPHNFANHLKVALNRPKTSNSATLIRNSVKQYSVENQLSKIIDGTLQDAS